MSEFKKYIITFKEGTQEHSEEAKTAKEFIESQGGKITHDYGEVGFAAEVPVSEVATASDLKSHKSMIAVEAVEEDGIATTQ
ncbi:peptidase inhibitor I9 [Rhizoctonia solani AG-3 Rhs1AP]|uniref:Peptidase inhibitor I9 n=2 Tax=Rhizoctonia solani AG-3 TaxID=1086053 RepID=A0A074RUK2_9AGAM|nr:peptidase inhibitor I9 [Rhizoctonia solani AG-3 Rhs1AP]KEP48303.1 peptidase inhibitor I9 [Rhizoctonia solani 123E]